MAKYEGSKRDRALDKKGAKRAGVSVAKFEGSAADKKIDAKERKRMAKGKR
jgi:hypothetical protein